MLALGGLVRRRGPVPQWVQRPPLVQQPLAQLLLWPFAVHGVQGWPLPAEQVLGVAQLP